MVHSFFQERSSQKQMSEAIHWANQLGEADYDMIRSCEFFFKTILWEQVSHKKRLTESQSIFYIL